MKNFLEYKGRFFTPFHFVVRKLILFPCLWNLEENGKMQDKIKKRLSLFEFCLLAIISGAYMKVSEDIDVQMLNEFKQGRLEMLYRRLYPALLLYAVRYAGEQNSFLAEDCVQNAVFNAWKRRLQFESVESLKSFLYISIKNEIVSLHRKAKASERYLSQLEEDRVFSE